MATEAHLPNASEFNAFAARVREFRDTLPEGQRKMLDAMVHAAFKNDDNAEIQAYWLASPHAGWYGAPYYYGTPWAYSYGWGYRYW